jgi:hypothetical protein
MQSPSNNAFEGDGEQALTDGFVSKDRQKLNKMHILMIQILPIKRTFARET